MRPVGQAQRVSVEPPVVEHAEGEHARDVLARFLVADGLDPEVRVHAGTLRLPAREWRWAGVVTGDRLVGLAAVLVEQLAQVGGSQVRVDAGIVEKRAAIPNAAPVPGSTCIRPIAFAPERARGSNTLSARISPATHAGSRRLFTASRRIVASWCSGKRSV